MERTIHGAHFANQSLALQAIAILAKIGIEAKEDKSFDVSIYYFASDDEEQEINKVLTDEFCDHTEIAIAAQEEIRIICRYVAIGRITLDEAYKTITSKSLNYFAGYTTLKVMKMLVKAGSELEEV